MLRVPPRGSKSTANRKKGEPSKGEDSPPGKGSIWESRRGGRSGLQRGPWTPEIPGSKGGGGNSQAMARFRKRKAGLEKTKAARFKGGTER